MMKWCTVDKDVVIVSETANKTWWIVDSVGYQVKRITVFTKQNFIEDNLLMLYWEDEKLLKITDILVPVRFTEDYNLQVWM